MAEKKEKEFGFEWRWHVKEVQYFRRVWKTTDTNRDSFYKMMDLTEFHKLNQVCRQFAIPIKQIEEE